MKKLNEFSTSELIDFYSDCFITFKETLGTPKGLRMAVRCEDFEKELTRRGGKVPTDYRAELCGTVDGEGVTVVYH